MYYIQQQVTGEAPLCPCFNLLLYIETLHTYTDTRGGIPPPGGRLSEHLAGPDPWHPSTSNRPRACRYPRLLLFEHLGRTTERSRQPCLAPCYSKPRAPRRDDSLEWWASDLPFPFVRLSHCVTMAVAWSA